MKKSLCRFALLAMTAMSLCSIPALADSSEPAQAAAPEATAAAETKPVEQLPPAALLEGKVFPDLLYKPGTLAPKQRIEMYQKLADKLDLTEDQKKQIKPIIEEYREMYSKARLEYGSRIKAILGTPYMSEFDRDKITIAQRNQLRQVLREIIIEGKAHIIDFRNTIKPLLTEDQRNKLAELVINWYEASIVEKAIDRTAQTRLLEADTQVVDDNGSDVNAPKPKGIMLKGPSSHRATERMIAEEAANGVPAGPPPPEMVVQVLTEKLDLTAQQQEQVLSIIKKREANLRQAHQEVRDKFKAQMADGQDPECDGKGPKCDGKGPNCDGKGPKCECKDPKCQGKDAKCECKDPKCQGKDAKCECKDPKCQGKDAKCECKGPKCQGKDAKCECKDPKHQGKCDGKGSKCQGKDPKGVGKPHPGKPHPGKPHNDELGKAIREKIQAERAAAEKEISAVLTPEQQKKFAEIMAKYPMPLMAPPPPCHPRGDMRPHRDDPPFNAPACKDAACKDAACKDAACKDATCKDATCKDAACKDAACKDAACKDAACKDAACKDAACKDAACKDAACK